MTFCFWVWVDVTRMPLYTFTTFAVRFDLAFLHKLLVTQTVLFLSQNHRDGTGNNNNNRYRLGTR